MLGIECRIETIQGALRQSVAIWQECKSQHTSATYRCNGHINSAGRVYQRIQDLKRELAAKTEALNRLQQECVDLDSRIHLGITPMLTELNNVIGNYEGDIADLTTQIAELNSKIAQIKERYKECTDELTDQIVITSRDVPGTEEDLEELAELVDLEKNMVLQATGKLGKISSGIVIVIQLHQLIGDQQKNACCALMMMKFMLTSGSYSEASGYAYAFVHLWNQTSGLPEIPTVSTSAALGLANIVDRIPEEKRQPAIAAIDAVLRSARYARFMHSCLTYT